MQKRGSRRNTKRGSGLSMSKMPNMQQMRSMAATARGVMNTVAQDPTVREALSHPDVKRYVGKANEIAQNPLLKKAVKEFTTLKRGGKRGGKYGGTTLKRGGKYGRKRGATKKAKHSRKGKKH